MASARLGKGTQACSPLNIYILEFSSQQGQRKRACLLGVKYPGHLRHF